METDLDRSAELPPNRFGCLSSLNILEQHDPPDKSRRRELLGRQRQALLGCAVGFDLRGIVAADAHPIAAG